MGLLLQMTFYFTELVITKIIFTLLVLLTILCFITKLFISMILSKLINFVYSLFNQDVEGKTPLHSAIENGDQTTINLLLDQPGLFKIPPILF